MCFSGAANVALLAARLQSPPHLFLETHVQTGYHPARWGPPSSRGALTNLFRAVLKERADLCASSEIAAVALFHHAPYLFNRVDLDVGEWN